MSEGLPLSVVIPTYNRKETVTLVLDSLTVQTLDPSSFEVIVVDSGSQDGTRALLEGKTFPFPFKFFTQENRGRAGARNRGIQESSGEIILFTDADIIAHRSLLEEHLSLHRKARGTVQPQGRGVIAQSGTPSAKSEATSTGPELVSVVGCEIRVGSLEDLSACQKNPEPCHMLHPPQRKKLFWLYFLTGNASVPREVLDRIGGFDESFQGYGWEDVEMGYRLYHAGIPILYNAKAYNYHLHPVHLSEAVKRKHLAGISAVNFYKKHQDWKVRLYLGMNPVSLALHGLLSPTGTIMKACRGVAEKEEGALAHLCREIVLQHHYLSGVKEALKGDGWKKK